MSSTAVPDPPRAPTAGDLRRDRHRLATAAAHGRDVSLRAVAAEMGLTPPALYRYVDSHAELMALVARAVFADVVGDDDGGARPAC